MAYNGSGLFLIDSTGQPVAANTLIEASVFNALTADVATGLSTALTKDGQTTVTANLPMAGYRHTGVGNASARTMYAAAGQVQDNALCYGSVGGTADAITLTLTPAITAYAAGQKFAFIASGANTTAVTINVNSVGAKDVTKFGTTALAAGDIASGMVCVVVYDGTRFQLIGAVGATVSGNNTWTGTQTFRDNKFEITDDSDTTKKKTLQLSGLPTGVTKTEIVNAADDASINDFRMTLTSGTPVTTSDVTAAGTIYACPYKGKQIALYDGTIWNIRTSAEFSLALSGLTSGKPYDVFCYDNAGTPTLEFLVWTNDTTRATALAYQDGVLVKSGATTRRYLGTFYTTSTTTTEDSAAKRYLWNYYHRADRTLVAALETTNTWTYTTNTWRQANANAANQLDLVVGVAEDAVFAHVSTSARNGSAQQEAYVGIGVDSTTTNSATLMPNQNIFSSGTHPLALTAEYVGIPGAGRHYLAWLEIDVTATGTTTWLGDNGGITLSRIHGMMKG